VDPSKVHLPESPTLHLKAGEGGEGGGREEGRVREREGQEEEREEGN